MAELLDKREADVIRSRLADFGYGRTFTPLVGRAYTTFGSSSRWTVREFGITNPVWVHLLEVKLAEDLSRAVTCFRIAARGTGGEAEDGLESIPDKEIEPFSPRELPRNEVEQEISHYLKEHPGSDAFDMAIALRLEPRVVFDVCDQLLKEGVVEFAVDTETD